MWVITDVFSPDLISMTTPGLSVIGSECLSPRSIISSLYDRWAREKVVLKYLVRSTAKKQDDRLISAHIPFLYLPTPYPVSCYKGLWSDPQLGNKMTQGPGSCPTPPPPPHTHTYTCTHPGSVVSELTITNREHAGTVTGLSPTDKK